MLTDIAGLCVAARNSDYVQAALGATAEPGACTLIGHAGGFNVATSRVVTIPPTSARSDAGSDVTVPPVTVPKRSERSDAVSHRFTTLFVEPDRGEVQVVIGVLGGREDALNVGAVRDLVQLAIRGNHVGLVQDHVLLQLGVDRLGARLVR